MSHKTATVDDTVYFWFAANDTSGSGGDGSTPLYDVREAGAAAGAIPLLSGTPTLLSHANYPAGCHEIAVAATTGNGFAADDTFAVFCTLAIDSQNPSGFVGSCTLTPLAKAAALATVDTNVDSVLTDTGTTIPATLTTVEGKIDTVDTNVDSVLTDTGTTIPATIATAQIDLDSLTDVLSVGVAAETRNDTLIEQLKLIVAMVEHQRGSHTHQPIGNILFVDPTNGDTHASGNRGGITDPYSLVQDCHDNAVTDSNHDLIILLSGASGGATTLTEDVTLTKRYLFIRGPGRDFIWTRTGDGDTISITADGIEISGCQINTASGAASGNGISIASADFCKIEKCWFPDVVDTAIDVSVGSNYVITGNHISGCDKGVHINSGGGSAQSGVIEENSIHTTVSHGIHLAGADASFGEIHHNRIWDIGNDGITINASCTDTHVSHNEIGNCTNELIDDNGTDTVSFNNTDITSTLTAMQTDVTSILADTDELQTDDVPGLITALDAVVDTVKAETALIVADTNELQTDDIPTTLATLATAANLATVDTVVDAIKVVTDRQAASIIEGTCSGTPTTTTTVSDVTITVDDQFNGRIITFRDDTTTTALQGQQTDITDSTASGDIITFTALATAPVSGDTFDIM